MNFLEEYGFDKSEIQEFLGNTPKKMVDTIAENVVLVKENLDYIKKLGIKTYKEIFINYPDMFLMDNSNFTYMFLKYNTEELIAKLNKNYKTVEYL
jgi:predicted nucleotidyltransferase